MGVALRVVATAAVLTVGGVARADAPQPTAWKQLYSEGAFTVSQDGSQPRPTYKAEGIIEANIFDLMAVLADVGRRKEWVKDLAESRILEGKIDSRVVIYEHYRLPWPLSDRDSVVESVIHQDLEKLEVEVEYHEVTHANAPERVGITRMPSVRGTMHFRAIDATHASAQLILGLDVGGHLPQWGVERVARKAPILTIEGLQRQVKKTRGQYDAFIREHQGAVPR